MLAYNEFAYKKTKDHCKLEDTFQKKAIFQSHILEFADKKTSNNEGRLYYKTFTGLFKAPSLSYFFIKTPK
jgi:hypothetical protein